MKTALALINACAALALVAAAPMHAGINYERYLQEEDRVASELDDWMSKYGDDAEINGWLPPTESRSADEIREDRQQRFFMARELVDTLHEENPEAEFTTDSPFSLMTEEEFATYVRNSYIAGEPERMLRSNREDYRAQSEGSGNGRAKPGSFSEMFAQFWNNAWKSGRWNSGGSSSNNNNDSGETAGEADVSAGKTISFQDLIDWMNNRNQGGNNSNGRRPSNPSRTPSPNPNPIPYPNPTPSSSRSPAPVSPPSQPISRSPKPATNPPNPNPLPVAPTDAPTSRPSPNGPVGPVAPPSAPGGAPAPTPTGETAGDGNKIDWSGHKCMAPVQNQGSCGSCWAFATVSATETGKCIASKAAAPTKLSEQHVASCDKRNMGCNGGAISTAMQYIQQNGACSAADVPYTAGRGSLGSCNSACTKVASGVKSTTRLERNEAAMVAAIGTAPVVIAVAAGNNAWKQYKSGVVSSCQTQKVDHAVVAVGYDDASIIIRNSWGATWGEKGYMRVKRGGAGTGVCSMYTDMYQIKF